MVDWQAFPSGSSTGINAAARALVDPFESIGTPADPPATDVDDDNSAFSLMKGILAGLGLPAGAGSGTVHIRPSVYTDPLAALGDPGDAAATVPSARNTAISLLKGIFAELSL